MRKWFWCCTAAAVVAAGLFGTAKFCSTHPDSPVTKAVAAACEMGLRTTPFTGQFNTPANAEQGSGICAAAAFVPCHEGDDDEENAVVQVNLPGNEEQFPAQIVIRDDEDLKERATGAAEEAENFVGGEQLRVVEWQAQPTDSLSPCKKMPHCDEEDVHVAVMPYAEEDWNCESIQECLHLTGFLGSIGGMMHCGACTAVEAKKMELCAEDCPKADCSVSLWRRFIQAISGADVSSSTEESEPKEQAEPMKEESREEPRYHDHDQYCPRGNYPYSNHYYSPRPIPVEEPKVEPRKGGQEESEEVKPEKVGKNCNTNHSFDYFRNLLESQPTSPRIDTMEFRPSDHQLFDYGQGPGTL